MLQFFIENAIFVPEHLFSELQWHNQEKHEVCFYEDMHTSYYIKTDKVLVPLYFIKTTNIKSCFYKENILQL